MKITILSVGNIKEKYLKDAINEYAKRLSKYAKIEFLSVSDEPIMENPSIKEIESIKIKEGEKLLKVLPNQAYKVALSLKGVMLSSEELAIKMQNIFTYQGANICFIIGGSLGLGQNILKKVDYELCFSKMTFPHQLMQVILLEQVYRCFKINNHEIYHK